MAQHKNSNIKDVARRAGVSIATVSHVINGTKKVSEDTRKRVQTAIEGLHYQPNQQARSLRLCQNPVVYLLIESRYLEKYSSVGITLVTWLSEELRKRHLRVETHFFESLAQCSLFVYNQDFIFCYVLGEQGSGMHYSFPKNVYFLSLELEYFNSEPSENQIELSAAFYHQARSMQQSGQYTQLIMSFRQGKTLHRFIPTWDVSSIHFMDSELSRGGYYLETLYSTSDNERVLFTDYTLFSGAIRHLLQHEDLLCSKNINLSYLSWGKQAETYGLPVSIQSVPADLLVKQVLSLQGEK